MNASMSNRTKLAHVSARKAPIAAGFNAWFPPDVTTIRAALSQGLVVVDTNILLSLYRYDPDVTEQWLSILRAFGDRLWIPHQAMVEFWKNRATLASHAQDSLTARDSVEKAIRALEAAYEGWISSRGKEPNEQQKDLIEKLQVQTRAIRADVEKAISLHKERFDANPDEDEVVRALAEMTSCQQPARVGAGGNPDDLANAKKMADERFARNIPPGYMDDASNSRTSVGKSNDSKYGDYLLWAQALEEGKQFAKKSKRGTTFLVLVTADLKEDWWKSYVSGNSESKVRIPRPELVEEMRAIAGVTYIQLDPSGLLDHVESALGLTVTDDAKSSTAALAGSASNSDWLPGLFIMNLTRVGAAARARISPDGKKCMILKDSTVRRVIMDHYHDGGKRMRTELIEAGVLVAHATDENLLVFSRNHLFGTTSAAAGMVLGANAAGPNWWKSEDDGRSLAEVLLDESLQESDEDEIREQVEGLEQ